MSAAPVSTLPIVSKPLDHVGQGRGARPVPPAGRMKRGAVAPGAAPSRFAQNFPPHETVRAFLPCSAPCAPPPRARPCRAPSAMRAPSASGARSKGLAPSPLDRLDHGAPVSRPWSRPPLASRPIEEPQPHRSAARWPAWSEPEPRTPWQGRPSVTSGEAARGHLGTVRPARRRGGAASRLLKQINFLKAPSSRAGQFSRKKRRPSRAEIARRPVSGR